MVIAYLVTSLTFLWGALYGTAHHSCYRNVVFLQQQLQENRSEFHPRQCNFHRYTIAHLQTDITLHIGVFRLFRSLFRQ